MDPEPLLSRITAVQTARVLPGWVFTRPRRLRGALWKGRECLSLPRVGQVRGLCRPRNVSDMFLSPSLQPVTSKMSSPLSGQSRRLPEFGASCFLGHSALSCTESMGPVPWLREAGVTACVHVAMAEPCAFPAVGESPGGRGRVPLANHHVPGARHSTRHRVDS